jgi:hypothetical protein
MTTEAGVCCEGARRGTTTGVGEGEGLAAGVFVERRWRVRRVCAPAGKKDARSAPHKINSPKALLVLSGKLNTLKPS